MSWVTSSSWEPQLTGTLLRVWLRLLPRSMCPESSRKLQAAERARAELLGALACGSPLVVTSFYLLGGPRQANQFGSLLFWEGQASVSYQNLVSQSGQKALFFQWLCHLLS